jgi:hypothetical protein
MTKGFREEKVTYDIVYFLGRLGERDTTGFQKECNIVSWCDKPARIDIRGWNEDHSVMRRGVSLTDEEGEELYKILKERYE